MIDIFKFIRGYVEIKVWGFAPERFLNLCSNKNILLWNIRKDGEIYYMCISLTGFRQLKAIVRKTRTKVVILKRIGLPFLIPKIFARKVFIVGLFTACFFWFWSSLYIWKIEITGNQAITEDIFMDLLAEQGIRIGIRSASVDIEELEKNIRKEFSEITWTSAKLSGTSLMISVKENDAPAPLTEEEGSRDLYAEKDGKIVSMIVRAGVPIAKIGDEIEMGSLLVAGRVPVFNEDATVRYYKYVRADADIYVERFEPVSLVLPFDYTKKVYTGREKKKYFIVIGEKEILFGGDKFFTEYDVVMQKHQISLLKGLTLPFSYGTKKYREYQNVECSYTLKEAENLLKEKYSVFLSDLEEKGVQIIEKNVKIDSGSGGFILQGELKVREKIGAEVFLSEENDAEKTEEMLPQADNTGAE